MRNCSSPNTHHQLLHLELKQDDGRDGDVSNSSQSQEKTSINQHATTLSRSLVMLKVVPLRVIGPNGRTITTYALLDSASVTTMITSKLAQTLQLKGHNEEISINTVVNSNHSCNLQSVGFDVTPVARDQPRYKVRQALVVENLNIPEQYCPNNIDISRWSHLQELELDCVDVDLTEVSVLMGQDVPQAHVVDQYCWGDDPSEQPYGMKTPFAWCVAGPTNTKDVQSKPIALSILNFHGEGDVNPESVLHQQVEKFWSLENYGFKNSDEVSPSVEDNRATRLLKETTKQTSQGYEVGLLWKKPDVTLPNNKELAEQRLRHLKKRFTKDEEFAKKYRDVIDDYLDKGYAKKLSEEEAKNTSDITWYLPHHGVVNPNKSKIRVVFDAAAEYSKVSLNKELLQGPQLNNTLLGVLLRFRQEKVALMSDIESMFHRVRCNEQDTDALRFLWWSEGLDKLPTEHKMVVHLFGKTDSPCIAAWALKKTAEDHGDEFSSEVSRVVNRNFYVDDCLVSVPDAGQAIELAHDLMTLLKRGNFRLTKFTSNDKDVLSTIPTEERLIKNLDLDHFPAERALGVQWDVQADVLGVQRSLQDETAENTRRECLSILSSTFDPFGMIAPVMLPAKRIVQRTWQLKLNWDEVLPDDLLEGWKRWKDDLVILKGVTLPRCYFKDGSTMPDPFNSIISVMPLKSAMEQ